MSSIFPKLKIKATVRVFGAALAVGIAVVVAITALSINQIRIGGSTYNEIVRAKDLVADILPPPLYVIEAYLEASLAYNHTKSVNNTRDSIKKLRKDYDERRDYWSASEIDAGTKKKLVETSHAQALKFWNLIDQKLLPAIERHDDAAASQAYQELTQAYQAHRAVIDEIVTDANALSQATEASAAHQGSVALWSVGSVDAVMLALLVFGVLAIIKHVVNPIVRLTAAMNAMSSGDFEIEIPSTERNDEMGEMASALVIFRDQAVEKARLESQSAEQRAEAEVQQRSAQEERLRNQQANEAAAKRLESVVEVLSKGLQRLSGGDFTTNLAEAFPPEYQRLQSDFNATVEKLQLMIGSIKESIREVANAAGEISTSTTDLSQRTEEQAASIEETTSSMEEISATVKKNAESAQQANESANRARDVADRSGEVVARAIDAMAHIEESSRKIADIIGVIDEIARQTNLLALNAAVEAARAGDAGRGFAVVASEVRSLAQRSSQAAKDIKDLITNSNGQVQEGVELVNKAGAALAEIVQSVKSAAMIVSDIAEASAQQAAGLEQVNQALVRMDTVTQQNSALVEENAATAKTLEQHATAMNEKVALVRVDAAAPDGRPAAAATVRSNAAAPAARPRTLENQRGRINTAVRPVPTSKRVAAAASRAGPVGRMQRALAAAVKDDAEWTEF